MTWERKKRKLKEKKIVIEIQNSFFFFKFYKTMVTEELVFEMRVSRVLFVFIFYFYVTTLRNEDKTLYY